MQKLCQLVYVLMYMLFFIVIIDQSHNFMLAFYLVTDCVSVHLNMYVTLFVTHHLHQILKLKVMSCQAECILQFLMNFQTI